MLLKDESSYGLRIKSKTQLSLLGSDDCGSKYDGCQTAVSLPEDEMINPSALTGVLILVRILFHLVLHQFYQP